MKKEDIMYFMEIYENGKKTYISLSNTLLGDSDGIPTAVGRRGLLGRIDRIPVVLEHYAKIHGDAYYDVIEDEKISLKEKINKLF